VRAVTPLQPTFESADQYRDFCMSIRSNPVVWASTLFGIDLWRGASGRAGQAEVLESCFANESTTVASGHKIGKTELIITLCPLWLISHPGSFFVLSAAAWSSLNSNLVPGMANVVAKQPFLCPGKVNKEGWKIAPRWGMVPISTKNMETAQGYHSPGLPGLEDLAGTFVAADEASTLEVTIYKAMVSLIGGENHMLMTGNPLRSSGPFADAIREGGLGYIQISSLDTPNYRAGKILKQCPGIFSQAQEKKWLKESHGSRDSAEYKARVLGILPDQSEWQFIPRSWILDAKARTAVPRESDGQMRMAVDVGRSETGDPSVVTIAGRTTVHYMLKRWGVDQGALEKWVFGLLDDPFWCPRMEMVAVDATGLGSPLADRLVAANRPGLRVVRVVGQAMATDNLRWFNQRAEAWGNAKDALDPSGPRPLCIPEFITITDENGEEVQVALNDEALEMTELEYKPLPNGQTQLEEKLVYKKRVGHSPDVGDCIAMLHAQPLGEAAFPAISATMHGQPKGLSIDEDGDSMRRYLCRRAWVPGVFYDEPRFRYESQGVLCRGLWLSEAEASACVWVHVDNLGRWTVYDCLSRQDDALRFLQVVAEKHPRERYTIDVLSARANPYDPDYFNAYIEAAWRADAKRCPDWMPPEKSTGEQGLSPLSRMILATAADFPNDPFWKGSGLESGSYRFPEQLRVGPQEVLHALKIARRVQRASTDDYAAAPTGLVNEGGSIVRALRMLAVSGAGQ
jgi:hypothetical protein